jgi:hypothetical protein
MLRVQITMAGRCAIFVRAAVEGATVATVTTMVVAQRFDVWQLPGDHHALDESTPDPVFHFS